MQCRNLPLCSLAIFACHLSSYKVQGGRSFSDYTSISISVCKCVQFLLQGLVLTAAL